MAAGVLVVDSEPVALAAALRARGCQVLSACTLGAALRVLAVEHVSLIIAGSPCGLATELITAIHAGKLARVPIGTPILAVADSPQASVALLDGGADAVIIDRKREAELYARVRTLTRRSLLSGQRQGTRPAVADSLADRLTPRERILFDHLLRELELTVSRVELLALLRLVSPRACGRSVDRHIGNLRRKLLGAEFRIATIWGIGYRLEINAPLTQAL